MTKLLGFEIVQDIINEIIFKHLSYDDYKNLRLTHKETYEEIRWLWCKRKLAQIREDRKLFNEWTKFYIEDEPHDLYGQSVSFFTPPNGDFIHNMHINITLPRINTLPATNPALQMIESVSLTIGDTEIERWVHKDDFHQCDFHQTLNFTSGSYFRSDELIGTIPSLADPTIDFPLYSTNQKAIEWKEKSELKESVT